MEEKSWEDHIYAKGLQFNSYPYDSVVSAVLSFKPSLPEPLSALDLGCGTGNHLRFFAENGFKVLGIEQSETAVNKSREFVDPFQSSVSVIKGDLTSLPETVTNFNYSFILDRGSLTHNSFDKFEHSLDVLSKLLKPGGIFMSVLFSDNHPSVVGAMEESSYFYSGYTQGIFADTPMPALFLPAKVCFDVYQQRFKILRFSEKIDKNLTDSQQSVHMFEVICTNR